MAEFVGPAGVHEGRGRRTSELLAAALALALVSAGANGCAGGRSAPEVLVDGSKAVAPPTELEAVSGAAVATVARIVDEGDVSKGSPAADCLRGPARDFRPDRPVVERVGVHGSTVTLQDRDGLYACDDTPGPKVERRRWCGGSFGHLSNGRLLDPRLDIGGCRTTDGEPVAFLWIQPAPGAAFVAVRQPGYAEVYPVAGGLPVRISTVSGLDTDPLGATIDVSEHDQAGKLLRDYEVRAFPAG